MNEPVTLPDSLDLGSLAQQLRRSWLLLLLFVLVFAGGAAAAAFLTTPSYRARVVMIPAQSAESVGGLGSMLGDLGGIASLAGLDLGGGQSTTEAVAYLKSRQFAESFIRERELLPVFFSSDWDASRRAWRVSGEDVPSDWDAWRHFDREIRRVSEDRKAGVFYLDIFWEDPAEAARWANELVKRVNVQMRDRAVAEAELSIALLQKEAAGTEMLPLRQAIYRLIESHVKRRTMAQVREEFAFRVVDPASPSDLDDFVKPKRGLYLVAGPVAGFLVGMAFVLSQVVFNRRRRVMRGAS